MLEAVVALAIIGLVCVSVLAAFGVALRADIIAADRLPLAALATERLSAIDLSTGALDHLPDSLAHGSFSAPYQSATWIADSRRVSQTDELYDVAVSVHDGSDTFTLRTRRYRRSAAALSGQ